jgi:REP element-mobilizing transposase RayT
MTNPLQQQPPSRPHGYLPRLQREWYRGLAVVHWTLTIEHRATGWLTDNFHSAFRELMLHTAARQHIASPAYCLMPDHMHIVWMGLRESSDQFTGMAFLRTHLEDALKPRRFQSQAHDHVLREEERQRDAFAKVCFYVLNNPVRKELVAKPDVWRYRGALVAGYPKLHPCEDDYWDKFWRIYGKLRDEK